jgi:hypothetical protein
MQKTLAAAFTRRTLAGTPAEFFLVAACCRWPPSETRVEAIRTAAAGDIDWSRFLRIVKRHRVWGLVSDGLARGDITPEPRIAAELRAEARHIACHNLTIASELIALDRRFVAAGISVVFVKGLTLAMLAYGDLAIKHSMDVDILVAPVQVMATKEILIAEGFELIEPSAAPDPSQLDLILRYSKEWAFFSRAKNRLIELHWKLSYNPLLLHEIGIQSARASVAIGPFKLETLCLEDLFVFLCVHGAQHGWTRLKWLADLAALLNARKTDLRALYRRAIQAGAGRPAGQALLLCERLLGLELPPALRDEFRSSAVLERLEAFALDTMLGGDAEKELQERPFGTWRVVLSLFFLGEGWHYHIAEMRRYLISSADVMALALPERLAWLYPLVRLPLWIKRSWGWAGSRTPTPGKSD